MPVNEFLYVPEDVKDYLKYLLTVEAKSKRTVNAYYIDLRLFFRYIVLQSLNDAGADIEKIDASHLTTSDISAISKETIFNYVYYLLNERDNSAVTRARKLSAVKGFFHYMNVSAERMDHDPARDIKSPKLKKAFPKYLSLDESIDLLKNLQTDFESRDYCMITLFLNCGMRLSELSGMNVTDFRGSQIRILGKGNKERFVYLNEACLTSLQRYLQERSEMPNIRDANALFISKRTGKRLSNRRIEQIVEKVLQESGLSGRGFSPHKLRHTAATLMYQYGNADMLSLQKILGHARVSTTEIYTHTNEQKLQNAVDSSPLAHITSSEK